MRRTLYGRGGAFGTGRFPLCADSEYDRYVRARREEDAYYSALRRVRYEDELRDRFYEEERLRQEALRRIRYDEALREQEYARRCGPDHRAPYAAAPEGGYPLYASGGTTPV